MEESQLPQEEPHKKENETEGTPAPENQPEADKLEAAEKETPAIAEPVGNKAAAEAPVPVSENAAFRPANPDLIKIKQAVEGAKTEIRKVIVGQDRMIDLLLAGLFTGGHILLEGVPGIAKTLSARLLSKTLSVDFSRIQFTPDLMPTDVTGTSIFNLKDSEFNFNAGPIFSNIVLIDEINRAPAKTQAALFEVMEERQVTVDGTTYPMEFPFQVIATQNPIEQEGTYQLPEAQLDRFLFKVVLDYPSLNEEIDILKRFRQDFTMRVTEEVKSVMTAETIKNCQAIVERIHISDQLIEYIARLVNDTRNNGDLYLGASPRASLAILRSSKAIAAMRGRDFVTPDDIKFVTLPVLNHRVVISPDREMEGIEVGDIVNEIIQKIEVPR
ncbi:MAG: AAA family ATPase [Salibacteraceae bacterium]